MFPPDICIILRFARQTREDVTRNDKKSAKIVSQYSLGCISYQEREWYDCR
jgi:hypothetical protein